MAKIPSARLSALSVAASTVMPPLGNRDVLGLFRHDRAEPPGLAGKLLAVVPVDRSRRDAVFATIEG
jgi:hypothetical protein